MCDPIRRSGARRHDVAPPVTGPPPRLAGAAVPVRSRRGRTGWAARSARARTSTTSSVPVSVVRAGVECGVALRSRTSPGTVSSVARCGVGHVGPRVVPTLHSRGAATVSAYHGLHGRSVDATASYLVEVFGELRTTVARELSLNQFKWRKSRPRSSRDLATALLYHVHAPHRTAHVAVDRAPYSRNVAISSVVSPLRSARRRTNRALHYDPTRWMFFAQSHAVRCSSTATKPTANEYRRLIAFARAIHLNAVVMRPPLPPPPLTSSFLSRSAP